MKSPTEYWVLVDLVAHTIMYRSLGPDQQRIEVTKNIVCVLLYINEDLCITLTTFFFRTHRLVSKMNYLTF